MPKAYAKLHGSYKALIGGYVHNALADLTGFAPHLLVVKPGHQGYEEVIPRARFLGSDAYWDKISQSDEIKIPLEQEIIWRRLRRLQERGCLMGCSIQHDPGSRNSKNHEAEAGMGLRFMHAYSLLKFGMVERKCDLERSMRDLKRRIFMREVERVISDMDGLQGALVVLNYAVSPRLRKPRVFKACAQYSRHLPHVLMSGVYPTHLQVFRRARKRT